MCHFGVVLLVIIAIGALPNPVHAQTLPAACTNFSDDPVQPGITVVRAQHVDELRACVNALRAQVSLPAVNWTDAIQAQQTWIRAVHIVELRAALAEVFVAQGKTSPAYTDATPSTQVTVIRAVHITEIRNAILVVAGVCPEDGCNEVIEYYHVDAVGSVRAVTDETGAVILRRDYYPFGEGVGADGSTSLGFTGQEGDPESGLNYGGARYYRAWTGRFMTVDPIFAGVSNPQGWNRYAYALNSPLVHTDPTGLAPNLCFTRDGNIAFCDTVVGQYPSSSGGGGGGSGPRGSGGHGSGGDGNGRGRRDPREPLPRPPDPNPPDDPTQPGPESPGDGTPPPEDPVAHYEETVTVTADMPSPVSTGGGTIATLFSSRWRESCITLYVVETLSELNPMSPDLVEPFANAIAASQFSAALRYAASRPNVISGRGLLYPQKSSVFRSMLRNSELTLKYAPVANLAIAELVALSREWRAAKSGACR
jgi:RHS repeat-associated protein